MFHSVLRSYLADVSNFTVCWGFFFFFSLSFFTPSSLFGVSKKTCERMLTKQRGVADVYTLVLALRLAILAEGFSAYEGT